MVSKVRRTGAVAANAIVAYGRFALLELMAGIATSSEVRGLRASAAPTIFVNYEYEGDELHRRLIDIARAVGIERT